MTDFLSPSQLLLTERQHSALVQVLELLEARTFPHDPIERDGVNFNSIDFDIKRHKFNMQVWHSENGCGTSGCIGGTAELIAGDPNLFIHTPGPLFDLFYPDLELDQTLNSVTPEEAATQLRKYLSTGTHDWDSEKD